MTKPEYEAIAKTIVNCAFEVHKELGPGLLESVYQSCFVEELKSKGLDAKSQVYLPIHYKGKKLDKYYLIDILVEDSIAIELKATEVINPLYEVQLVTYMKLAKIKLGFLINFNVQYFKDGIRRKVNNYFIDEFAS
jgi:GxxExxY protein